jgi:CDGSH-type Zn-finger protein
MALRLNLAKPIGGVPAEKVATSPFVTARIAESKKVFFCGCKATASQPLCDGSHK